ncbi:MAG: hypothetical protein RML10_03060 [Geminocystis sp.]|nr:hypothetical protein [Geminocystis sp.]
MEPPPVSANAKSPDPTFFLIYNDTNGILTQLGGSETITALWFDLDGTGTIHSPIKIADFLSTGGVTYLQAPSTVANVTSWFELIS